MTRLLNVGLAVTAVATVVAAACSAGKTDNEGDGASDASSTTSSGGDATSASGGDGGTTSSADGGAGPGPGTGGDLSGVGVGTGGSGGSGGTMGCAEFTAEAQAKPAAMMITLDKSASMSLNAGVAVKWDAARFAVTTAMDKDVFDTMSLGLNAFPDNWTDPPQCFCDTIGGTFQDCLDILTILNGFPGVSCGFATQPQAGIALAGTNKSTAGSGVRYDIAQHMNFFGPLGNIDDGSPIYDALDAGYTALKAYPGVDERIMLLITDGGFSCASLSNPTRPGYSDGACPDWEEVGSVNTLISDQYNDATTPVRTFVVGVPGSDTAGEDIPPGCDGLFVPCYATAPYNMKNALSSYAASGSPDTIDPSCDGQSFTFPGTTPATPCHLDMTTGVFDANALADVIANIRGTALGCVYPLPTPPVGQTIDPTKVNVELTINGVGPTTIPARSSPSDDCAVNACWDYDLSGNIEILGKGCEDISTARTAKVDIVVGCDTIIN